MNRIESSVIGTNKNIRSDGGVSLTDDTSARSLSSRNRELSDYVAQLEKVIAGQAKELDSVITTNSRIISIIAHDLRSPFISILGILELIRDNYGLTDVEDIHKYINIASDSANSTLNLLDNLTDWANSQQGERTLNIEEVNLRKLFTDELKIIKSSAVQKEISLNFSIPSDLFLHADPRMLKTILRNLVNNAVKYSYRGGDIIISASKGQGYSEIMVQDNGMGISYEDQRKLFKKDIFHSTPGTDNEKGTGLGLLLCKEFAARHGGEIRVKSEPGKGCTFKVSLPQYDG